MFAEQVYQEKGCLWLPSDLEEWLTVYVDGQATKSEQQAMIFINNATRDWLAGTLDGETYFDILAQYEIDPIEHVGEVWQYLDYLMQGKPAQIG